MNLLIAKFKDISRRERLDEKTQRMVINKSYVVHVTNHDGTIDRVFIYFPFDEHGVYREPQLDKDETYTFPVAVRPTKDGKKLAYTALIDKMPFAAPKTSPRTA